MTGSRSVAFWNAAEAQRDELTAGILSDHGYRVDDAPVSLRLAAHAIDPFMRGLVTGGGR